LPFDKDFADFGEINEDLSESLNISEVIHQAVVEINEEGTVEVAATGVQMQHADFAMAKLNFNCNQPFLFIIHDKISRNILFLGKLVKPEQVNLSQSSFFKNLKKSFCIHC